MTQRPLSAKSQGKFKSNFAKNKKTGNSLNSSAAKENLENFTDCGKVPDEDELEMDRSFRDISIQDINVNLM